MALSVHKLAFAAAAALATMSFAPPSFASTSYFEIFGTGAITGASVEDNCWEDYCANPPLATIGAPVSMSLRVVLELPTDGTGLAGGLTQLSGVGYFSGKTGEGSFQLVDGKIVSGSVFVESGNDVCGNGTGLSFAGGKFSFSSTRCGFDPLLPFPYPFITQEGAGRITGQTRDGVAVPEPSAWAVMILGFGAVGASLRRGNSGTQYSIDEFPLAPLKGVGNVGWIPKSRSGRPSRGPSTRTTASRHGGVWVRGCKIGMPLGRAGAHGMRAPFTETCARLP